MAARAYVLIRTQPGLTRAIYSALKVRPIVQSVEMVTGPYDLIAVVEASSTNEVLTTIMEDIRQASGVYDTVTCLVIPAKDAGQA
jgi:DNA-binding Lrp family transcriptional regulator